MEVAGKKLSDQDQIFCQSCFEVGENIEADAFCTVCKEFLCSTCENEHRILKATKRHTLLEKTSMPKSMTDKLNEENSNVPCDIHPNEFIKYFCPTHEGVICGHCLLFEHRSCKISLISEIADSYKTGKEYSDIKTSIADLLEDIHGCACNVESNINMVLKIGEDEVKKLKEYREKVNSYFDEREKTLLQIIKQMKEVDKTRLDSLKPKCNKITAKLEEMECKLDAQQRKSVNLFIEAKKVKKQVEDLEAAMKDISKNIVVQRYVFIKDAATEKLLASNSGLGIVSKGQTHSASSGIGIVIKGQTEGEQTGSIELTSLRFTAAQSIQVKSPPDTEECRLTAMLLLPGDRLLLVDHNNSTVGLVDLKTSSMVSKIKLSGMPWGMCVLPAERVAVCLYDQSSVVFLETRGQITVGTSIKVDGKCFDIAYHNDQLVVCFGSRKVEKMDMEGKTITKAQALFCRCYNLTLMDNGKTAALFVSDFDDYTITKLDMDLNILQTFNDPAISRPKGLVAYENQLLICCCYKILHLDLSSGKIIEMLGIRDGLPNPYSAVYSQGQNKLYTTSYGSGKKNLDNIVHVYNAK